MVAVNWFWRLPRPLMMWLAIIVIVLIILFFVGIGTAIVYAYQQAALESRSVPDMSGGIAAIISSLGVLIPALASAAQVFSQRHRERMDQQARGLPIDGARPFPQSEPSPTGGLVNNEAINGDHQ